MFSPHINGKTKNMSVHRLVSKYFIENPLLKPEVNHKDGDKSNNSFWNLEWSTRKENVRHSFDTGLKKGISLLGSKHGRAKITELEAISIRQENKNGITQITLAKKYGISKNMVGLICTRKNWTHV